MFGASLESVSRSLHERIAAAVEASVNEEREACAGICEGITPHGGRMWSEGQHAAFGALMHAAKLIRARDPEPMAPRPDAPRKLVRDRSTPQNAAWWDAIEAAAKTAPRIKVAHTSSDDEAHRHPQIAAEMGMDAPPAEEPGGDEEEDAERCPRTDENGVQCPLHAGHPRIGPCDFERPDPAPAEPRDPREADEIIGRFSRGPVSILDVDWLDAKLAEIRADERKRVFEEHSAGPRCIDCHTPLLRRHCATCSCACS